MTFLIQINQVISQNVLILDPLLMKKAISLTKQMNCEFLANPGQLRRFKIWNGISFKSTFEESNQVSHKIFFEFSGFNFTFFNSRIQSKGHFNVDKAVLFYSLLPDKTFHLRKVFWQMDCISDGSEKLQFHVIGKSLKSHCFKNVKHLHTEYMANSKAQMTSIIFTNWLFSLDKKFLGEKRKEAMIVDNCPAHVYLKNFNSIKLIFLQPNATSILQSCDQGIIKN